MIKRARKPEKLSNLLLQIEERLKNDAYRFTKHALERKNERFVEIPDIIHVLLTGRHEKQKDTWDELYNAWNYAVVGRTLENQNLRVIVSFDDDGLLIITVIRLE